ncbi:MAG: hypothetical protein JWM99_1397 [Verrucomicrobiales bacterium]|nr:hypothetical protein [Verrucomicrobiales bacterium]
MKQLHYSSSIVGTLLSLLCFFGGYRVHGGKIIGPWIPMFKGVDHSVSTNLPANSADQLQVVHAIRVDLLDPDISLYSSPRIANYSVNSRETAGYTLKDFLRIHQLQIGINANFFDPSQYNLPAGTPMVVSGLAISQGVVVSAQENSSHSASIMFTTNNQPTVRFTNWPAASNVGVFTAVSGEYPVLVKGIKAVRSTSGIHDLNPRTVIGVSQDRNYLYLVTIDGRQDGYSDGAYDDQTAAWLLAFGAFDAVNMDGGGSTTLVAQDSTGVPIELNHSSAVAGDQFGRERTVGSHFGVFAKPLPGFINNVVALPDDTAAAVTWTTLAPATGQVEFGLSTNFTDSWELQSMETTNHTVLLTNLTAGTDYYFQVVSTSGGSQYFSDILHFATTNYLQTNELFAVDSDWKYTTENLDGINWSTPAYDDSSWPGSGPGLLWVDVRAAGPNPAVTPKNTQMPADPNNNGFPFGTYYFRKHFTLTNAIAGTSLALSAYVDDGAVFYLNGQEIYRLRVEPAPATIAFGDLAISYPCSGDATCVDEFWIGGDAATNLINGDNLLAAEVHNYNAASPDITFGTALSATVPNAAEPMLSFNSAGGSIQIVWSRNAFALQGATDLTGPWQDLPGPIVTSPYMAETTNTAQFYRLRR